MSKTQMYRVPGFQRGASAEGAQKWRMYCTVKCMNTWRRNVTSYAELTTHINNLGGWFSGKECINMGILRYHMYTCTNYFLYFLGDPLPLHKPALIVVRRKPALSRKIWGVFIAEWIIILLLNMPSHIITQINKIN